MHKSEVETQREQRRSTERTDCYCIAAVAYLVWWLLNHMPTTFWEVLVLDWVRIPLGSNFSGSAGFVSGHAYSL